MRFRLFLFLLIAASSLSAQAVLRGKALDEAQQPVPLVTVALLNAHDSTLAFFGISSNEGYFEIKNVAPGDYVLQAALMSYRTVWKKFPVRAGLRDTSVVLLMRDAAKSLGEVEIAAERIPIQIKKDTIEYDAQSFKTKPDAAAEDLLKKLPGVEVDRAGNIKAQGENVNKVLVDGKEFFGDDPKTATKNLPADAVKKVQVFDKKSDQTELTGIDDGERQRTINLVLKDDKKSAWLGDVTAGGGTDAHYNASGKLFRFTKNNQLAGLGMANNLNRSGFSFSDYLGFSGGFSALGDAEGGIRLGGEDQLPVNFGQPVTGLLHTLGGGLNFTHEQKKNNRFNISWLGNSTSKSIYETTYSRNFLGSGEFLQNDTSDASNRNDMHRFNLSWKIPIDSTQQIRIGGNASYRNGFSRTTSNSHRLQNSIPVSFTDGQTIDNGYSIAGRASVDYIKRFSGRFPMIRFNADAGYNRSDNADSWDNISGYSNPPLVFQNKYYRTNFSQKLNGTATVRSAYRIGKNWYAEAAVKALQEQSVLKTAQSNNAGEAIIDSLSGEPEMIYRAVRPSLAFRRNAEKMNMRLALRGEQGTMSQFLNSSASGDRHFFFFLPSAHWELNYKTGSRVSLFYDSDINLPEIRQLSPVADRSNPLQVYSGNPALRPEQAHEAEFEWTRFDQFSFTTIFFSLRGAYTHDKINWQRTFYPDLSQELSLVNVPDNYRASARLEYSTPIRKLGMKIQASAKETWNKGLTIIDGVNNINTSFTHEFSLTVENRKKEKFDIAVGGEWRMTDAFYSIRENLNNRYLSYGGFTEISWMPGEHFRLAASADITSYGSRSFDGSVLVPLVNAETNYYFGKSKRLLATAEVFDLLNRNTGLDRVTDANYLLETKSNIIRRYVLLSVKFRINKFESNNAIEITTGRN